jgi:hypothetical protein
VIVAEDLNEPAPVIDTEVMLDDHVPAIEVDMDTTGIRPSTRVHEGVSLNDNPGASPWPDAAAASVHAVIRVGTRSVYHIAAHKDVFRAPRLNGGPTDIGHVVVENLNPAEPFQIDCLVSDGLDPAVLYEDVG